MIAQIESLSELSRVVRDSAKVVSLTHNPNVPNAVPACEATLAAYKILQGESDPEYTRIGLAGGSGDVEVFRDDMVAVAKSGVHLMTLGERLREDGVCIPHGVLFSEITDRRDSWLEPNENLHRCLSVNPYHPLKDVFGDWRDWVIGLTLVLPNGIVCKVGSKAVKNVAGYDAQKLIIGSLGSYAVIAEVTMKLMPLKYVESRLGLARLDPPESQDMTETQKRFMLRAKEIFDPTHKLNPGIWGVM